MSNPPYRALRIILGIVSVFAAAAGLLLVFSGKPLVMRLLLYPPETEVSTLLLFMMRELGGVAIIFSVLFFFAFRDPVRNLAIVNGLIVGLCILAITPLLSLYTLDIRRLYPGYSISCDREKRLGDNPRRIMRGTLRCPIDLYIKNGEAVLYPWGRWCFSSCSTTLSRSG